MYTLIMDGSLALTASFNNTFNSLPCWSLPMASTSHVTSFDMLLRGIIPSTLTDLLSTIRSKQETLDIINNIVGTAQALFRDTVWNHRCEAINEWEKLNGLTGLMKRSSSAGYSRNPATTTNSSRPSASGRWKSWITQSIDAGRPWLGFHIHINSIIARLVQLR